MRIKRGRAYDAFRLGGGTFAQETDDLYRPNSIQGLWRDEVCFQIFMVNLEYRRKLLPFLLSPTA